MDEIEVPSYFLCPISLQIMKDPVTVTTGITYDRHSIEQWLFRPGKNNICPVTKQLLSDAGLTPNHTLRRLIQSWCTINTVERFPTPKPLVHKSQIAKLIADAGKSPQSQMKSLKRLKSIACSNQTNRQCLEDAGAVGFLASVVNNKSDLCLGSDFDNDSGNACDEALSILYNLKLSEASVRSLTSDKHGGFIGSLIHTLQYGSYSSRAYSVYLLKSISEFADLTFFVCLTREFFSQLVQLLGDQISGKATRAALQLLINVNQVPRNRTRAIESNVVRTLVDVLVDSSEKRVCEMVLVALDQLCRCAEGRAALLKHGAGMAAVSKKILRVSELASERAVRILLSVARFSGTSVVVDEMLKLGVVAKLCLVVQVDCGNGRIKEKAREILKMHGRVWRNSRCLPMTLVPSLPY